MAKEDQGEWKLLKVWECKGCKLLIRDGRNVFDHACTIKEKEDELLRLGKIIEEQNLLFEEKEKSIDNKNNKINSLDSFAKELHSVIDDLNNNIKAKDETIEEYKLTIAGHEATIDEQKFTIINQNTTIEDLKKGHNKVIEKIVYLEANASKTDGNNSVQSISVDILQRDNRIKDSKDSGYREEIEVEIFERGKGREKIIIKNGKVIKKPDDIIIIGENTKEGFVVRGIYRN